MSDLTRIVCDYPRCNENADIRFQIERLNTRIPGTTSHVLSYGRPAEETIDACHTHFATLAALDNSLAMPFGWRKVPE